MLGLFFMVIFQALCTIAPSGVFLGLFRYAIAPMTYLHLDTRLLYVTLRTFQASPVRFHFTSYPLRAG